MSKTCLILVPFQSVPVTTGINIAATLSGFCIELLPHLGIVQNDHRKDSDCCTNRHREA